MGTGIGENDRPSDGVGGGWPGVGQVPADQTFADMLGGYTVRSARRGGRYTADTARVDVDSEPERVRSVTAVSVSADLSADDASVGGVMDFTELGGADPGDLIDDLAMVRPYAWTGGRTRFARALQLQTLVSTSALGRTEALLNQVEHRAVAQLCRHPHSVAEVAAKLSIPLGVARVILSDMTEQGLISIHQTLGEDDVAAHLGLMERVLGGLRRL